MGRVRDMGYQKSRPIPCTFGGIRHGTGIAATMSSAGERLERTPVLRCIVEISMETIKEFNFTPHVNVHIMDIGPETSGRNCAV